MPIEEGDQYRLGKITFNGNKAIANTALCARCSRSRTAIFSTREKVRKGLENLRKAYGEYGYINFTAGADDQSDEEKKLALPGHRHG